MTGSCSERGLGPAAVVLGALSLSATCPDLRDDANELVLQSWAGGSLGKVREGAPPTGDYVPATAVGVGYVSRGYVE